MKDALKETIQDVPELAKVCELLKSTTDAAHHVFETYDNLLISTLNVDTSDIAIIKQSRGAMEQRGIRLHSASKLNTADFLETLQKDGVESVIHDALTTYSDTHEQALANLKELLLNGSNIAQNQNEKPKDGDPIWDRVIWGHTQARADVRPEVLLHFVLSHYLCQYMNFALGKQFGLEAKDDFINVLADMVLFTTAKNNSTDSDLYQTWSKAKDDGGLGWIDGDQYEVYREMVAHS